MRRTCAGLRALVLVLAISGCDSSTEPDSGPTGPNGVFILNEGAFLAQNAELSFFDPDAGTVTGNLYTSANDGETLGDVANAMTLFDGRLYVVVNNSSRVEVLDVLTQRSVGRISLPGLPRHMVVVRPGKAYVTMQDSTVAIVDPGSFTYVRSITTGTFPEGIVYANGRVFVMNGGFGAGNTIAVIDETADSVVSMIETPRGPAYAAVGPDGRVYVVCTGYTDFTGSGQDTPGAVLAIDPATAMVVDSLTIEGHPGKFALDDQGSLFLLGPGAYPATPVWRLTTSPSLSVLTSSLIDGSFYGIGVHSRRQEVLLADAGTFVTNGRVLVHAYDGAQRRVLTHGIGIAPSMFLVTGE